MHAEFEQLIGRVRAGDADAAAELVQQFASAVRVAVRTRLFSPAIRRQLDSMDICQSVMASFFVRVAAGQYELHHESQLVALLTKMAHNKLTWHLRYNSQRRRDFRRICDLPNDSSPLASKSPGPARQAEGRELLNRAWQQMDNTMREIAAHRLDGETWDELAMKMGGTGESRRKQFERRMNKIAQLLGIDPSMYTGSAG